MTEDQESLAAGTAQASSQPSVDYQRVFESAPALFVVMAPNEEFTILAASDAFLRATYTERDSIVGRAFFEAFPDNPGEIGANAAMNLRSSLERVRNQGRSESMGVQKYDVQRPESLGGGLEERYWSTVNSPVLGADGATLYILNRCEDVTDVFTATEALKREGEKMRLEVLLRGRELEEANRQLREATQTFQAMFEQGQFAARLRLDGTVIDVNRAYVEVPGFDRAAIVGRPFWDCGWWNRSPEVQEWVRNAVLQAVAGVPFRGETRYFWADGSEHVTDFACMPIKDAAGRVVVVMPTGMDITERVQAEQTQRALEAERRRAEALTEIDRAKTAFFSNVSHEFRTPLTLILGPLEELLTQAAGVDRERLSLIQRNALRLLKMVNALLEFSRLQAGRVRALYEPTDLPALTRALASNFRSACESAGLRLCVDAEPFPELVFVDSQMWETIVLNLLSNAFKYTFDGEIGVSVTTEGQDAVLRVRDTGIGIDEAQLPLIFERFHRVENSRSRNFEGTGIGLALVNEVVRLHQGSITVKSTVNRGTCFTVRVPLGCAHLPQDQISTLGRREVSNPAGVQSFVNEALGWLPADADAELEGSPVGPATERGSHGRILVADDNAEMREFLAHLLRPHYDVIAVGDGETALTCAIKDRPDLILADVMMPGLTGLELLKRLRIHGDLASVPILLLSARAGEEARIGGYSVGADDYLVKPFSARELIARVKGLFELTRLRRETELRFNQFANATADVIYRMSADWTEIRLFQGGNLVLEAPDPARSWLDQYIPAEDQPAVKAVIASAIDAKTNIELEHHNWHVDGSKGWGLSRAIPICDDRGEIIEWFGTTIDITGRKRAEELLRKRAAWSAAQKDAFQAAVNGAPLEQSLDMLTRAVRQQMEPPPRCTFHLACGKPTQADGSDRLNPCGEDRPAVADPPSNDCATGEAAQRRWAFPLQTAAGRSLGTFEMCHDEPREATLHDLELAEVLTHSAAIIISRHQEAEERARTAQTLSLRDRQKDEFLAMLAHELRNPLAPIGNAAEVLACMRADDAAAQPVINIIKRQAGHLKRLVDDLLDVSRITEGRIELRRQPIDLASVVTQAIETIEPQLREKQHRLSVVAATSYQPIYVNGDFARLVQCVDNILANAAKYTDPGGQIRVYTRADNGSAIIEISDTGAGISAELLPRVFDLFVQSDRTLDRAQGGLGIGLAIVKRLVQMHGGTVHATSAGLGHGSRFEIRLPRIAKPEAAGAAEQAFNAQARRVLIVDDNADAADSLSMLLSLHGHVPKVAYSGEEALADAAGFRPEIALLDIGLPGMNGYELAQQLRSMQELAGVRLVALTGYGQAEDQLRIRAAGFDDHLVKPVSLAALLQAFAKMLNARDLVHASGPRGHG